MTDDNGSTNSRSAREGGAGALPARGLYRWGSVVSAAFVGGLGVVLVCVLWVRLQQVIYLFLAGYLLAYALDPVIRLLQRRLRWSRIAAVWAVSCALVLFAVLAGWVLVPPLVTQALGVAENWDRYTVELNRLYVETTASVEQWLGESFPQSMEWGGPDARVAEFERWAGERVPGVLRWVSSQLLASAGAMGLGVLLLIISFQFMLLSDAVRQTARRFVPSEHTVEVDEVGSQIDSMVGQYLRGVIVLFFANGIGAAGIMYILGLFYGNQYALVVGLLTGLTNMVPYVGPVVSAGSAGLLTYVTAASSPVASTVLAVVLMLLMSQYFSIIVQPRLIGRRINLDPLVVLFAMFAGYQLFGLLGVIIGVPIAGCVKIVLAKWLPVIGPPPSVRAPNQPLLLDLGQVARDVWGYAQRAYGRGQTVSAAEESRSEPSPNEPGSSEHDAPPDDGHSSPAGESQSTQSDGSSADTPATDTEKED